MTAVIGYLRFPGTGARSSGDHLVNSRSDIDVKDNTLPFRLSALLPGRLRRRLRLGANLVLHGWDDWRGFAPIGNAGVLFRDGVSVVVHLSPV